MNDYNYKLDNYLFNQISHIDKPNILELGVQNGISTVKFLDLCNNNNGKLYSVDIKDCSNVSKDPNWKFFKNRDDNFNFIKSNIPNKIDVIFIDSLHEANHVEKIILGYYDILNINGYIFVDDISHLPYLKKNIRNNFYCEINNKETFNKILEIYNNNTECFDLSFNFFSSGLAIIKKKSDINLKENNKIKTRTFSFKNIIRLLWKKIIKN